MFMQHDIPPKYNRRVKLVFLALFNFFVTMSPCSNISAVKYFAKYWCNAKLNSLLTGGSLGKQRFDFLEAIFGHLVEPNFKMKLFMDTSRLHMESHSAQQMPFVSKCLCVCTCLLCTPMCVCVCAVRFILCIVLYCVNSLCRTEMPLARKQLP